jgi:hypothetical protein
LYLTAALVYLRFDRGRSRRAYAVALAFFVLALMTKTVTATLPATLLVLFWWQRGRVEWRRDVVPLLPWFLLAAAGGLFTAWVERRIIGAEGAEFDLSAVQRGLLAARVICFYLWKLIWPANLIFTYPHWTVSTAVGRQLLFLLGLGSVTAVCWWLRRTTRAPLASLLIFGGSLFPVLGFVNVYPFRYSYVADHFQYLASVAVIVPVAAYIAWVLERPASPARRRVGQGIVCALVGVLGLLTWRQTRMYRDAETLDRATIARNPDSWKEQNNLALILARSPRRMPEAILHYQAVIRLRPDHVRARYGLGVALYISGRRTEAVEHFRQVLAMAPGNTLLVATSHYFLGSILMDEEGRQQEALAELQEALRLRPGDVEARMALAGLLERVGRSAEASAVRAGPPALPSASNHAQLKAR